ncbi:glycosyltransferase family 4 protein [Mesorhizobium sp. M1399]|uniref:glycosyltransferase family 4 protein n=1 Tax=Mesorhizobium sp. M1399 TaxID=2957096 RepID=UPI0033370E0F
MRISVFADGYPPMRTSAAVQLRDLVAELSAQGQEITVVTPSSGIAAPVRLEMQGKIRVVRIRVPEAKDRNYLIRTWHEAMLPLRLYLGMRRSGIDPHDCDGIIWYSPTIFLGPLIMVVKLRSRCRAYLVLRDIFPEWAVDMGILRKGVAYRLLKAVANIQYRAADTIGVQSPGNLEYLRSWARPERKIEVLHNWLAPAATRDTEIAVARSKLAGRVNIVYTGNMGIAQGMDFALDLVDSLAPRGDVGFLFVGRGSEMARMRNHIEKKGHDNVLFFNEIDPDEIPGVLQQCDLGLVMLDSRHRTHNVPGKFVAYLQAGLPVLARVNPHNDLERLINSNGIGVSYSGARVAEFREQVVRIVEDVAGRRQMAKRARKLYETMFLPSSAADQILRGLK